MSEFWTCFLSEVKESKILSGVYLEKIIFQLDETVYPAEGRRMIAEYCGVMAKKLEEKIFIRYKPSKREIPDNFSEEEQKAINQIRSAISKFSKKNSFNCTDDFQNSKKLIQNKMSGFVRRQIKKPEYVV